MLITTKAEGQSQYTGDGVYRITRRGRDKPQNLYFSRAEDLGAFVERVADVPDPKKGILMPVTGIQWLHRGD